MGGAKKYHLVVRILSLPNHAQIHFPSGHAGMAAGTSKSWYSPETHCVFTLNIVKSSGNTLVASDLYAMASPQPRKCVGSSGVAAW